MTDTDQPKPAGLATATKIEAVELEHFVGMIEQRDRSRRLAERDDQAFRGFLARLLTKYCCGRDDRIMPDGTIRRATPLPVGSPPAAAPADSPPAAEGRA